MYYDWTISSNAERLVALLLFVAIASIFVV